MDGEPEPEPEPERDDLAPADFEPEPEPEQHPEPEPDPEGPELDCVPFVSYQCVAEKGVVLRKTAGCGDVEPNPRGGHEAEGSMVVAAAVRAARLALTKICDLDLVPGTGALRLIRFMLTLLAMRRSGGSERHCGNARDQ
eukprot:COSAG04_NODE_4850_length_1862_cov_2.122518_2_plen_140_part_00